MKKIISHLWFDKQVKEAAEFYVSAFPEAAIDDITELKGTPSGDVTTISLTLLDHEFMLIGAGPEFKFNPSISFVVACANAAEFDALWQPLSVGGKVLMEPAEYSFSPRYGWLEDKYGLSWQLTVTEKAGQAKIVPDLMFSGPQHGKAEEALNFYLSVFSESEMGGIARYGNKEEPEQEGTIKQASFSLFGQLFSVRDSALDHGFGFNESISFLVRCNSQEEIDYYWEKLSAVPESEQCGWLKDKFGVSWQIAPAIMDELMRQKDQEKVDRVTQAFLKMKKLDILTLEKAAEGR